MVIERPPERIAVDSVGVVLRRHRLDDVDRLHAAIEESRDHVRPFMPWADQVRGDTCTFVRTAIEDWERGANFNYLVTRADGPMDSSSYEIVGGCGLHRRAGPRDIEIGYWLHPAATGHGVITAAAAVLADVALSQLGVERVEIRCDEANVRSAGVARRLGFTLEDIVDRPIAAPGEHGRQMIWVRRAAPEPP